MDVTFSCVFKLQVNRTTCNSKALAGTSISGYTKEYPRKQKNVIQRIFVIAGTVVSFSEALE